MLLVMVFDASDWKQIEAGLGLGLGLAALFPGAVGVIAW